MTTRKELKNKAKLSLQGNWKLSIIIAAVNIYFSVFIMFSAKNLTYLIRDYTGTINDIGNLMIFVLLSIFTLGNTTLFFTISGNRYADAEKFLSAFNNIFRAIFLNVLISIFVFLWSMLLIVPGIIAYYRYKMAYYILSENPEISPLDAIKISKKITNGHKMDLFVFDLSFTLWSILCAATGGLVGLYVFPYYHTSLSNVYRELRKEYIMNKDFNNNENNEEKTNQETEMHNETKDFNSQEEKDNFTWNNH